jgi:uncharacterized C2H2 Zn-finger protein
MPPSTEKLDVSVTCPQCGTITAQPISWVQHDYQFRCPCCDARFRAKGEDFRRVRQAVEQLFASLPKAG